MRIIVQNVTRASCEVNQKIVGSISRGFCLFVGFTSGDNQEVVTKMANKLLSLRLFDDENGKTNLSLKDVNGEILSISQFTLYADCRKGNRPSFFHAGNPEKAGALYDYMIEKCRSLGYKTGCGEFGADMKVSLLNDGPFTIVMDSKELGF